MLHKIEALLRKAESTDQEAEAALFYEKAQELMEKYAISEEALWKIDPSKTEKVILETMKVSGDGVYDKFILFTKTGKCNRCRVWKDDNYSTRAHYELRIAGYPTDVAFVMSLYASIMLQMELALVTSLVLNNVQNEKKPYRNSFVNGFVHRIADRLQAQLDKRETTGTSTDLVLDRSRKVDEFIEKDLGLSLGSARRPSQQLNAQGYYNGKAAGDNADIGNARLTGKSGKKELSQ